MTQLPFAARPNLHLERCTLDDLTALRTLWYTSFASGPKDSFMSRMFPSTPGLFAWWDAHNTEDLTVRTQLAHYVKVVDSERNQVAGYAKWMTHKTAPAPGTMAIGGSVHANWSPESDAVLAEQFFDMMGDERERWLGGREHYYLAVLCTDPAYRRQGVGALLTQWGCDLADADDLPAYVDASDMGLPLYQRHGFEVVSVLRLPGASFNITACLRKAKSERETGRVRDAKA